MMDTRYILVASASDRLEIQSVFQSRAKQSFNTKRQLDQQYTTRICQHIYIRVDTNLQDLISHLEKESSSVSEKVGCGRWVAVFFASTHQNGCEHSRPTDAENIPATYQYCEDFTATPISSKHGACHRMLTLGNIIS